MAGFHVLRVKQGYFQTPDLLSWLQSMLLPALHRDGDRPRVVVLDNNSTHIDEVITSAIEAEVWRGYGVSSDQ